ncbi:MAG: 50S ribosomal protein L25 [Acidobacteria bacterium]|nr:50S ribosomal protein L25 [Acidobacteriota bacterium]
MISEITIEAQPRTRLGKGGARQLRRENKIPVTFYGGDQKGALSLAIDRRQLREVFQSGAGRNTIFQVKLDGQLIPVIIRDWQVDAIKGTLLHADLVRINMSKTTTVIVPVALEGEPFGVKTQGGVLEFATHALEVECLPGDIPDRIHVDVADLKLGEHISVKDLNLGDKVKVLEDPDRVIASVLAPRVEEVVAPAPAEVATAEPEVIKKGKGAEEEAGEG